MSELKTNLDEILQEKQNKIIPENIKKDIQIFDVIGTYEGSGGTDYNVKLFETEEEMQADSSAKEGDLAVVYREEVQNMTSDTQTQYITFPETVTLPTAQGGAIARGNLIATDGSSFMSQATYNLTSSTFSFNMYASSGRIQVQYESTDGITYTRTLFDTLENPVDLGTMMTPDGTLPDNCGYFMQIGENVFEGLFRYNSYIDKEDVYSVLVSDITFNYNSTDGIINMVWNGNEYTTLNVPLLLELQSKVKETEGITLSSAAIDENDNLVLFGLKEKGYGLGDIAFDDNKNQLGVCYSSDWGDNLTLSVATLNLESKTYTLNEYQVSGKIYVNTYKANWNYFPFKLKTIVYSLNNNKITCSGGCFVVGNTTTGDRESYRGNNSLVPEDLSGLFITEYEYQVAPNQLTATKDLVYNSIYSGKDGINEGILTQNISNSFADVNAEIYNKIQQVYNNMEPRILTDSDKAIDKNIYFIPTNSSGEVLLDTSQVTNMSGMFDGCSNLTEIPQLNTSNATKMDNLFKDCLNLSVIPVLDTNKVTSTRYMFAICKSLTDIPLIDTSNVTDMTYMVYACSNLISIPQLNTSNVTSMNSMFDKCTSLTNVPLLDTSKVTDVSYMFNECPSLSNDSLNNILQMCANAVSYTRTKELRTIGLSEEQAQKCTTLSNYSAFTAAGWTTGY